MTTFPRFVGLSPSVARELVRMAERNGWDPIAIAAVIEGESGWDPKAGLNQWHPRRTATGLLQFIEATARTLASRLKANPDVTWLSRDWVGKMSAKKQLELVEEFYRWLLDGKESLRPVDYYAAPFGRGVGAPLSAVLVDSTSNNEYQPGLSHADVYQQNAGLDSDGDGRITVGDLAHRVDRRIERAYARGFLQLGPGSPSLRHGGTGFIFALSGLGLAAAVARARLRR